MKIKQFVVGIIILVSALSASLEVFANAVPPCPAGATINCYTSADGTVFYKGQ